MIYGKPTRQVNFYKKLQDNVGAFYKKVSRNVGNGLKSFNDVASNVINTLEKVAPIAGNVASVLSENPYLAGVGNLLNTGSGMAKALSQGIKTKQNNINGFANRLKNALQ